MDFYFAAGALLGAAAALGVIAYIVLDHILPEKT